MKLQSASYVKITRDIWTLYFLDDTEQYFKKLVIDPEELVLTCCNSLIRDYQYKLPLDLLKIDSVYYVRFYNKEEAGFISNESSYHGPNMSLTLGSYNYDITNDGGTWSRVLGDTDRSKSSAFCYFAFDLPRQIEHVGHTLLSLADRVELLCGEYLKLTKHVHTDKLKRPIII